MEDEGEFVALAVGEDDVGVGFYDFDGCAVHEVDCAAVVWFDEVVFFGESVLLLMLFFVPVDFEFDFPLLLFLSLLLFLVFFFFCYNKRRI